MKPYSHVYLCKKVLLYTLLISAIILPFNKGYAQANVENFGQNRIQKRLFGWKYFDTKHFRVYHYDKAGRQLGRYVAEEAENNIEPIETKMGGEFPDRFNIVLYNSYDDYVQTNIGLRDESQLALMTKQGSWNLVGDKLVVYYTGKHTDLRHQIQAGMAQVVMQRMIYGENFKKMLKTSLLLNLPQWVTEGFISYLTDGWNADANSEWKRLLDANPDAGFFELSDQKPELAGKAFWKFIHNQYGLERMKSLLAALQQKTSLNKAMKDKDILGLKVTKAYDSCINFYKNCYAQDLQNQQMPDSTRGLISLIVPKTDAVLRHIVVSPRGTDIAFVAWKNGEYQVITQKTAKDQTQSVLLEGGDKDRNQAPDPNYPLLCWSPSGHKLAILYYQNKRTRLKIYNNVKGRIENYAIPPKRFDRVLGMAFMQDDDKMIFSAIRNSKSDLYSFTIKGSKLTNITDDAWDDIDPVFVSGGARTGILFLSNRPKPNLQVPEQVNELPTGNMNVFFYNTTTGSTQLLQCTHATTGHISQPIQYGNDHFAYLYDANGIQNNYIVMFARDVRNYDSAYSLPITNYTTGIISHQYNAAVDEVADVIQIKNRYRVYFYPTYIPNDTLPAKKLVPTTLSIAPAPTNPSIISKAKTIPDNNAPILGGDNKNITGSGSALPEVKQGNIYQSEFDEQATSSTPPAKPAAEPAPIKDKETNNPTTTADGDSSTLSVINDSAYVKMKPATYKANFKQDLLNFRVDNSILFTQYQSYANNAGQYRNPDLGLLTSYSIGELLEDKKLILGFQLPLSLATSTVFIQYVNNKRLLDWSVLGYRTQSKENKYVLYTDQSGNPLFAKEQLFKCVTNLIQADVKYPLDKRKSLRLRTAFRQDRLIQKAQDTLSLRYEIPNTDQYWTQNRLEYVFDNTVYPLMNIRLGTRYKLYAEYMNQLNGTNQSCYNIGFDFRTYTKLYKHTIWATRVAYAHSDGTAKVEYQAGGVDNWMKAKTAQTPSSGDNYGYISLATGLRGYLQAARKGNNFALINTEIRLPVCATFIKRPVQSATLNNFQVVAFADAGSAWRGFLPDADNTSITYTYPQLGSASSGNNNVAVSVTQASTSGLMLGYGAGFRTTLLGYFVRTDFAWNIEGSKKPIVYVGIGVDF